MEPFKTTDRDFYLFLLRVDVTSDILFNKVIFLKWILPQQDITIVIKFPDLSLLPNHSHGLYNKSIVQTKI